MKKNLTLILSVILICAMILTGCSSDQTPESTAAATTASVTAAPESAQAQPLSLKGWVMTANTWSSPNGATINISASTNYYEEGQKADFVVRLEGEEVASVPCKWDSISYTASVDLNAANGYCYYVVLTAADGTASEVAVNTPDAPTDETLIDLEASLESYCSITVEESIVENNKLTLTSGQVQVKTPRITSEEGAITCQEAVLILSLQGEELTRKTVTLTQTDSADLSEAVLENIVFDFPTLENDQTVDLTLSATLTNGQTLTAFGGNWFYSEEGPLPVVG